MREAWRLNAVSLRELSENNLWHVSVFIVFNGQEIPEFHEVGTKMKLVLSNLSEKLSNQAGKN